MSRPDMARMLVGWREWVALPELGILGVKAKIDTGARTSSLHAFDVTPVEAAGRRRVRFKVHPLQRSAEAVVEAEADLVEWRHVRSSGGHLTLRPVIETTMELFGERVTIELTLATRDTMGFRMLLGRQALRGQFVVDPGRSFVGGRPGKRRSARKRTE